MIVVIMKCCCINKPPLLQPVSGIFVGYVLEQISYHS
jgi:hypothetical protein